MRVKVWIRLYEVEKSMNIVVGQPNELLWFELNFKEMLLNNSKLKITVYENTYTAVKTKIIIKL